jgi:hypothetical protein
MNESAASAPTASESEAVFESLVAGRLWLAEWLLNSRFKLAIDVGEQVSNMVSGLLQLVDGLLGGLLEEGEAPSPLNGSSSAPIRAPPPAPPPVPSSTSSSSLGGSSGGGPLLPLGALALLSIPLLKSRFSYPSRELLRPSSVPPLALERPG